jgi:hypothetical protein
LENSKIQAPNSKEIKPINAKVEKQKGTMIHFDSIVI